MTLVEELGHKDRGHLLRDVAALLHADDELQRRDLLGGVKARQLAARRDDLAAKGVQPGGVAEEVRRIVGQAVAPRLGRRLAAQARPQGKQRLGGARRLGHKVGAIKQRQALEGQRQAPQRPPVGERPRAAGYQRRHQLRHPHQVVKLAQQALRDPLPDQIMGGDKDVGTVAARDRRLQLVGHAAVRDAHRLDQRRLGAGAALRLVPGLHHLLQRLLFAARVGVPDHELGGQDQRQRGQH